MRVFEFNDYKVFVLSRIKSMPKRGRGQWQKIAEVLRVHPTLVSQIFKGERDLTMEQAFELAEFLGLNRLEVEFFLLLVNKARAGTMVLKQHYERQIQQMQMEANKISSQFQKKQFLDEEAKALFYSNWYYSAIRLLTDLPQFNELDSISQHFDLPKKLVRNVIDYLLQHGLCIESEGQLKVGPNRTHLDASSPHIGRHHTNWRVKAIENFTKLQRSEMAYTSPMTLSKKDTKRIRDLLSALIGDAGKIVDTSPPETLYCLNIDWFEIK